MVAMKTKVSSTGNKMSQRKRIEITDVNASTSSSSSSSSSFPVTAGEDAKKDDSFATSKGRPSSKTLETSRFVYVSPINLHVTRRR